MRITERGDIGERNFQKIDLDPLEQRSANCSVQGWMASILGSVSEVLLLNPAVVM